MISTIRPLEKIRQKYRIRNDLKRCALAEFFGSTVFVWTGTSVLAQTLLSRGRSNEYVAVALGWGFALVLATQLAFRISGGHLNPAVSLFFLTIRQISPGRFGVYALAQLLGSFCGAFLTFLIYYDAINAFDGGLRYVSGPLQTARIFATYPADHLSTLGGFFDQVLGTAFLCICIGAITDHRNRIPSHAQPSLIGVSLALIGMCFGFNAGFGVNPARDLGPRIFSMFAGYGFKTFSFRSYKWFWAPVVGPLVGGVLGGWLYNFAIGLHIPSDIDDLEEKVRQIQLDKSASNHPHTVFGVSPTTTVHTSPKDTQPNGHNSTNDFDENNRKRSSYDDLTHKLPKTMSANRLAIGPNGLQNDNIERERDENENSEIGNNRFYYNNLIADGNYVDMNASN